MAQHISFPSIDQFRNVIRSVKDRCAYHGIPLPELEFVGTTKLHGTNSGVAMDVDSGEIWVQSRNNIITPESDNVGFARFVQEHAPNFRALLASAKIVHGLRRFFPGDTLVIYGEWCGQGIQKGVAVSQLPRMFVVFGIRVKHQGEYSYWFSGEQINDAFSGADLASIPIYSIYNFKTFKIAINFASPELVSNRLGELTQAVEDECPVGKHFGVIGVGEGIVWVAKPNPSVPFQTDDLVMKIKGEKHSESKVKTLAPVDVEKLNSIKELIKTIVTDYRLEKKLDDLREAGFSLDVKATGEFLKIVSKDVLKEEADTIEASGLDQKDVMKAVSSHARQWFMTKLDA